MGGQVMGTPIFGTRYVLAPTPEGEEHPNVMVTDLRKAAQMALEALEIASRNGSDGLKRYEIRELDDTIAELHAALAQPEQEPVMFNGLTEEETNASASVMGLNRPKPEPVLWMMPDGKTVDKWALQFYGGQAGEPLYKAPPQRNTLPLSDDEIKCIKPICADFVSFRAGVRHAEREHGIGGEHE